MVSLFQLLVAHIVCKIAAAFPQSQNPQMMTGPIETGKSMCQEIVILKNVSFTTYNQVISSNFTIPHCGANLAILSLQGQVSRGRQYDRFGAVWFDDIEVMRLTTPEPNNETNISWNVSQDISDYINGFTSQNIIARISIPNEVTDVYTGVIYINLILRLYKAQDMIMPATFATALVKPDFTDQDPLSSLSVNSGQSPGILSTNVSLDFAASQIKLRVLASAHGNEEFWYSNIPGDSSYKGIPGGGTFREILVTVDGIVAGTQPAFPYIYSGGLNPLAWRPLASIGQFAIPPYEFDLTPFAARLVSNCSITISIVSDDTEEDSIWYLSPSLLAWEYQQNTTLTEIDLTYAWLPASVVVLTQNSSNRTLFISEGHSNLYIRSITSVLTQEDIPREE